MHRWRRRLNQRVGQQRYQDLLAGRGPRLGERAANLLLLTLCAAVDLCVLGSLALVGWAVLTDTLGMWHWVVVALAVALVYVLAPRVTSLDDGVVVLSRAEAPLMWALVDDVAKAAGTASPRILGVRLRLERLRGSHWLAPAQHRGLRDAALVGAATARPGGGTRPRAWPPPAR